MDIDFMVIQGISLTIQTDTFQMYISIFIHSSALFFPPIPVSIVTRALSTPIRRINLRRGWADVVHAWLKALRKNVFERQQIFEILWSNAILTLYDFLAFFKLQFSCFCSFIIFNCLSTDCSSSNSFIYCAPHTTTRDQLTS